MSARLKKLSVMGSKITVLSYLKIVKSNDAVCEGTLSIA